MRELVNKMKGRFRNLVLYGIIGSSSALLDFLIFTLLTQVVGIYYLIANCISVPCGLSNSFYWNRNYNFKVKDKTRQRLAMFFAVGLCGLLLSSVTLYLLVNYVGLQKSIAKLIAIVFVVLMQFVVNSLVTFKK